MSTQSKFVIMKHEARKAGLHYDLRFKMPKSKDWDSYAVRKGVPTESGKKVLAVKTTIHTEKEALLTGYIKDGYGAGKLSKWDGGSCIIHKYSDRHITIEFKGSKIKGIYHLISTGVIDKKFEKPTYLLFKGNPIKEGTGMISRIPAISSGDEVEEGPTEEKGISLKWSLTEGIEPPEIYAMVCQFTAMKGFFKKKPAGEFIILALKDKNGYMLLQFFQHIKEDLYLIGLVGGGDSPDEEHLELVMDQLRYDSNVKILEDKIPVTIKAGNIVKFIFSKPSKYLGKSLELFRDSRLPDGYFIGKCNLKKGFSPVIVYKMDGDISELGQAKKMRAFTSSRFKKIMKIK